MEACFNLLIRQKVISLRRSSVDVLSTSHQRGKRGTKGRDGGGTKTKKRREKLQRSRREADDDEKSGNDDGREKAKSNSRRIEMHYLSALKPLFSRVLARQSIVLSNSEGQSKAHRGESRAEMGAGAGAEKRGRRACKSRRRALWFQLFSSPLPFSPPSSLSLLVSPSTLRSRNSPGRVDVLGALREYGRDGLLVFVVGGSGFGVVLSCRLRRESLCRRRRRRSIGDLRRRRHHAGPRRRGRGRHFLFFL